jgi:hypothetical protein
MVVDRRVTKVRPQTDQGSNITQTWWVVARETSSRMKIYLFMTKDSNLLVFGKVRP